MAHFGRLRQIIRERSAPPVAAGPSQRTFTKSLGAILLPLHWAVVLAIAAVWFWQHGSSPLGLLFCIAWGPRSPPCG
jgi:hypothetical protein